MNIPQLRRIVAFFPLRSLPLTNRRQRRGDVIDAKISPRRNTRVELFERRFRGNSEANLTAAVRFSDATRIKRLH